MLDKDCINTNNKLYPLLTNILEAIDNDLFAETLDVRVERSDIVKILDMVFFTISKQGYEILPKIQPMRDDSVPF